MNKKIVKAAKTILGVAYPTIRRIAILFLRTFPAICRMLFFSKNDNQRLLVIYDLSCQPFSVGDILTIQEASLVLRLEYNLDKVDFALVHDPSNPASPYPAFKSITEKNASYHLASLLPVAQVNQHLGSLFSFNSHNQLERFIENNIDFYPCIWPSAWKYAKREYLYWSVFNDLLFNYYQKNGSIPTLGCRKFLIDWARSFYKKNVFPSIPVTVQFRNNKEFSIERNLAAECWIEFFQYCEKRYSVKFIIICALSEIDERLRDCSNIVIAKDFHTNIEEDLALIHEAALHMGAASGPGAIALFNKKPYLKVGAVFDVKDYRGMVQEGSFVKFCFAGPFQRFALGKETSQLLKEEFAKMWASLDIEEYNISSLANENEQDDAITWLR